MEVEAGANQEGALEEHARLLVVRTQLGSKHPAGVSAGEQFGAGRCRGLTMWAPEKAVRSSRGLEQGGACLPLLAEAAASSGVSIRYTSRRCREALASGGRVG